MTEKKRIIIPGGQGKSVSAGHETQRSLEREREDKDFVPVIIKRSDESVRHPDDVLEKAIEEGLEQLNRRTVSLVLSSIAAGLILGFTAMAVGVTATVFAPYGETHWMRLANAVVYPFGFVLCIMSGAQLFTEHTATAVYPILDQRSGVGKLLRLWALVVVGNLIGALCSAFLLVGAEPIVQAESGYLFVAEHLVQFEAFPLIVSAVLAGWLMALGAWLILATPPTVSQIVCVYIVTFLIGIGGLHHSIAGAVEILTAFILKPLLGMEAVVRFILLALAGNLIGGSMFVALLNYGHIRKSRLSENEREKHEATST